MGNETIFEDFLNEQYRYGMGGVNLVGIVVTEKAFIKLMTKARIEDLSADEIVNGLLMLLDDKHKMIEE